MVKYYGNGEWAIKQEKKAMKVKILVECDPQSLEKSVNEFIADKQVIDIKFNINDYPDYFALVMYEDK